METQNQVLKKERPAFPSLVDVLALIIIVLAALKIGDLAGKVLSVHATTQIDLQALITYTCSVGFALLCGVVFRLCRRAKGPMFEYHFNLINYALIIWGFIMLISLNILAEPLQIMMPKTPVDVVKNTVGKGLWGFVMTVILAPVLEEMLFRGVILDTMRKRWGTVWAILGSSAMFSLIHNFPQQVVSMFLIGVVLGYVYVQTKSIVAVIVLHAINNVILFIMTTMFPNESITLKGIITNPTAYWTIYALAGALVVAAMIAVTVITKRRRKREEAEKTAAQNVAQTATQTVTPVALETAPAKKFNFNLKNLWKK